MPEDKIRIRMFFIIFLCRYFEEEEDAVVEPDYFSVVVSVGVGIYDLEEKMHLLHRCDISSRCNKCILLHIKSQFLLPLSKHSALQYVKG